MWIGFIEGSEKSGFEEGSESVEVIFEFFFWRGREERDWAISIVYFEGIVL